MHRRLASAAGFDRLFALSLGTFIHLRAARPEARARFVAGAPNEFTPGDEFDVGGKYVTERTTRDGVGAASVAIEREPNENAHQDFAPSRISYRVTVIAQFQGRRCILIFEDPLAKQTIIF